LLHAGQVLAIRSCFRQRVVLNESRIVRTAHPMKMEEEKMEKEEKMEEEKMEEEKNGALSQ